MTFFIQCRKCGHTNPPDATVCAACHQPLDVGIRSAMTCPVCGTPNGAGAQNCTLCGYNLEDVERIPAAQRTVICPYCQTANPPPVKVDAAAYCINCGREIQLPGADYSFAELTPNENVCPICAQPSLKVSDIKNPPDSALGALFAPPVVPFLLRREDGAATVPPGRFDVEETDDSETETNTERAWDSEVGAVRAMLGIPGDGDVDPRRLATARYREAQNLWQHAYYCETDKVVFVRRQHAVHTWSPQDFATEMREERLPGTT